MRRKKIEIEKKEEKKIIVTRKKKQFSWHFNEGGARKRDSKFDRVDKSV